LRDKSGFKGSATTCFVKKIALLGFEGAGKSTLAYSLSKHFQKNGVDCGVANFDAACKHIKYSPVFDVRKRYSLQAIMEKYGLGYNAALKRVYSSLARDSAVANALNSSSCEVLLLDVEAPVEVFLSDPSFLKAYADSVVFVADSNEEFEARLLAALQEFKYGLPVLLALNKADVSTDENPQKGLHGFGEDAALRELLEPAGKRVKAFSVSAMDRRGFNELTKQLMGGN